MVSFTDRIIYVLTNIPLEVAWQQYFTARAVLAVHNMRMQMHSSKNILELNRYAETYVLGPARSLCGVCFMTEEIGSQINGSHLISWCGQFFTGKEEQRRILEWLEGTMLYMKWPNRACIERLQQIWMGKRVSWSDKTR